MRRRKSIMVIVPLLLTLAVVAAVLGLVSGPMAAAAGRGPSESQAGEQNPALGEPERVREILELRDATSKTFELADGSREWVGYGEAVHYRDAMGVYQEIDNTVVKDSHKMDGNDYQYRNVANSYTARFGATTGTSRLVSVEYQGRSVSFGLAGAKPSEAAMKTEAGSRALSDMTYGESCLTYPGVYPGVDLAYEPQTYGVREYLVLRRPTVPNQFDFDFTMNGVSAKEEGGRIVFVDDQGETIFWLGAPVAVDDVGVATNDVAYALSGEGKSCRLTVTLSRDYLDDPSRVFPVVLDPDLMITGSAVTYDTWVCSRYPNNTYTYSTYLRTGKDTSYYVRRTFLRFDLSAATSIPPELITQAYVRLEKYSGATPVVTAYRCTSVWSSGTLTWNTMPSYTTSECSTTAVNDSGAWWRMYNLTVVKKWLSGAYAQYGWMIRDSTESNTNQWTTFYACDAPSPHKPELHILYSANEVVYARLACDGLFRAAAGSSWSSVASDALERADNAFAANFGIDFGVYSTNPWMSPIDQCGSSPTCDFDHSYGYAEHYGHLDPWLMIDDAVSDLGLGSASMMVCITGAPHMTYWDSDYARGIEYGGLAYTYGANKCIVCHDYLNMLTWQETQHELSHCFGDYSDYVPDHTSPTYCVMYVDQVNRTIPYPDRWCSSCAATIMSHRLQH